MLIITVEWIFKILFVCVCERDREIERDRERSRERSLGFYSTLDLNRWYVMFTPGTALTLVLYINSSGALYMQRSFFLTRFITPQQSWKSLYHLENWHLLCLPSIHVDQLTKDDNNYKILCHILPLLILEWF